MHTDSIDWLTQPTDWVTDWTDWLTNLTSYISYISLRCSSPRNFQSSFGGIWIFSVSVLSSKAKWCCFCQILCRILTQHIINKNFTNCWHEEILTSVGMITVFLFLCMYILDFISYFILAYVSLTLSCNRRLHEQWWI